MRYRLPNTVEVTVVSARAWLRVPYVSNRRQLRKRRQPASLFPSFASVDLLEFMYPKNGSGRLVTAIQKVL